jgi:molecular chaperone GrpE
MERGRIGLHDNNEEIKAQTTDRQETAPAEGELETLRTQAADYEDRWKRAAAEFQNYRRRTESERTELLKMANGALLKDLLPVLDDLERALAHIPVDEAESKWVEGTRLVEKKFRSIMERQGLTPIESIGAPFDPEVHEAIGGSGTHVAEEYQRGYKLHGRTLRPAMVVVGEAPAGTKSNDDRNLDA